MTTTTTIGARRLSGEDIRLHELDRARHALAYLKDKLGNDTIRQLLEPDTTAMTAQVRRWADASHGQWRSASVELTTDGPSAAGFYDWYRASTEHAREADLWAGHPEHFINHPVPGMLEVIENIGETDLPWRVFYRNLPDSAPFPRPWDDAFPVRFGAEILDATKARVGWSMRQLRDTPHGTRFRITSSLPSAAPEELTDRHLHHMAIEYTNWARIARNEQEAT